jgi:C-terminal domain of Sin3a protein
MITFQLLSKDGSSLDDAEVLSGRWHAYVEGFVSDAETPGVPTSKVRRPFLRRWVIALSNPPLPPPPSLLIHIRYHSLSPTGLYPPLPRLRREQEQEQEQGRVQDTTFTRVADWRSKSACGPTGSSTSRGPRTCYGARLRARKTSARERGSL